MKTHHDSTPVWFNFLVILGLFTLSGCADLIADDFAREPSFHLGTPNDTELVSGTWAIHVVTADKRALSWGLNSGGSLGQGHAEDVHKPNLMRTPEGKPLSSVRTIASGSATYVVTEGGSILAYGPNTNGALGIGVNEYGTLFCGIDHQASHDGVNVSDVGGYPVTGMVDVAAGVGFGVALDKDGQIWTWGSRQEGQLGDGIIADCGDDESLEHPVSMRSFAAPIEIDENMSSPVVAVEAGIDFVLALTADGQVYAWGGNREGQLGNGGFQAQATPSLVMTVDDRPLNGIKQISAGGRSAAAITATGEVYVWGRNRDGQLGLGNQGEHRRERRAVLNHSLQNITAIDLSTYHAIALDRLGRVYAWGSSELGALGPEGNGIQNEESTVRPSPTMVAFLDQESHRAVKILATSSNSYALDENGVLFAWGSNSFGQIGVGTSSSDQPVTAPTRVTRIVGDAESDNASGSE